MKHTHILMTTTSTLFYEHVVIDQNHVPRVGSTGMKVIHLVIAQETHGYSVPELHFQFPDISMGEVHAALAYYWDHKVELDQAIQQHDQRIEQIRLASGESPASKRLRSLGYLS